MPCARLVQNRHKSQKNLDYRLKRRMYPILLLCCFVEMLSALASFESERLFNKNGGEAFLKTSETCKLSFLSILIDVCKERCLYDITICGSSSPWKNGTAFFNAIEKILVVDQWLIHLKARKPVLEWNFIEKTLRYYNFGDSLITWVKLFYLSNRKRFPCLHSLIWTREGLGEFETVMQTRDEVWSLHNCREFSQHLEYLYQAMQTQEKSFLLLL